MRAWLIEDKYASQARWWRGFGYSTDANQAIRFARKADAEKVILTALAREPFELEATEHGWDDGVASIAELEAENQRLKADVEEVQRQLAHYKEGYKELCVESCGHEERANKAIEELQAANLAHEQYRKWAAWQMEQAAAALEAARLKMDSWVGDLEGIEADPVKGDPGTTVRLVIKSINLQIEIMTAKKP